MAGPKFGLGTVKAAMPTISSTREHRVARADDAAAEREHRPIGDDDAGLRQRVEPERAGDAERDLAQPEGERRPEIAAEQVFMTDGEQQRHVAGRRE